MLVPGNNTEGKEMKKILIELTFLPCFVFLAFLLLNRPVMAFTEGQCGDDVYYYITDAGYVNISGRGAMWDYSWSPDSTDGRSPFAENDSIKGVRFGSGVTHIGKYAFIRSRNLTNVQFPDTLLWIGGWAFAGTGLSSPELPESLNYLDDGAFESCLNISQIYLPDQTTLLESPFRYCENLTAFSVSGTNPYYSVQNGVLFNKSKTELVDYPGGKSGSYQIPGTVKTIHNNAFIRTKDLTAVTFPDSIETIGYYAFEGCTALTDISLPDSVRNINNRAFYGCTELKTVRLPEGLTEISHAVFCRDSNLETIVIPQSVSDIRDDAFGSCTRLKRAFFTEQDITIHRQAFSNCPALTMYVYSDTSACTYAQNENIPFVLRDLMDPIDGYLPYDLTIIEAEALAGIDAEVIYVSDHVTAIGSRAFSNCRHLRQIRIPEGITEIADDAFEGCPSGLIIYGRPDTLAHDYARAHHYIFAIDPIG